MRRHNKNPLVLSRRSRDDKRKCSTSLSLCIFSLSYMPRSQNSSTVVYCRRLFETEDTNFFSMAWPFQMIACKHNREMCSNPTAETHIIYFHFSRHQETKTIPANLLLFSFRLLSKNSVFKWVNIFALQCAANWNFCLKCAHISTHQCISSTTNSIYRLIKSRMPIYTHKYENALENVPLLIHELLFFTYTYIFYIFWIRRACALMLIAYLLFRLLFPFRFPSKSDCVLLFFFSSLLFLLFWEYENKKMLYLKMGCFFGRTKTKPTADLSGFSVTSVR